MHLPPSDSHVGAALPDPAAAGAGGAGGAAVSDPAVADADPVLAELSVLVGGSADWPFLLPHAAIAIIRKMHLSMARH